MMGKSYVFFISTSISINAYFIVAALFHTFKLNMIRKWNLWKHKHRYGDAGKPGASTDRVAAAIERKLAFRRDDLEELRRRYGPPRDDDDDVDVDNVDDD